MKTAVATAVLLLLGGCAPAMKAQMHMVDNLKIQDASRNYEAAERGGDPLDMCVKAKLVAAAYDEAREQLNARAWRAREHEACELAVAALGVKRPVR
jgi:hypothetical protein